MARSLVSRAGQLWTAAQPKFHGQYSAERLRMLHDFSTSTLRTQWTVAVLVLTPLPCLVINLLLDSIPLNPPSAGPGDNLGYWFLSSISNMACSVSLITLYETAVPTLRLSWAQVLTTASVVAACTELFSLALSSQIGFPVPFVITLSSPVYLICSLCNHAFVKASPNGQMGIALFVGALKIVYKSTISKCIREQADRRSEIVNFYGEIFNAMFLAFSMQNVSSASSIAVLVPLDIVHTCATNNDLNHSAIKIGEIESRLATGMRPRRRLTVGNGSAVQPAPMELWPSEELPPAMIKVTLTMLSRSGNRIRAGESLSRPNSNPTTTHQCWRGRNCFRGRAKVAQAPPLSALSETSKRARQPTVSKKSSRVSVVDPTNGPSLLEAVEDEYTTAVLRLLYTTEFVALTELVECVVPVIYALYVTLLARLPNRIYFPFLATADDASVSSGVRRMLAYGLLEVVSLLAFEAMAHRRLGISPTTQLAMVLKTQWRSVQATLVLWVIINVQAPLEHYGADYSFEFAWLSKGK